MTGLSLPALLNGKLEASGTKGQYPAPNHTSEQQTFQMRIFLPYNHFRACN